MISIAHSPIVQEVLDRWRLQLPVPAQLDESLLTKDHLRLLISMLIKAVERTEPLISDLRPPTSEREQS